MSDTPGEHLTEEPQSERGPMGSRDTGSDEPGGGPADRRKAGSKGFRSPSIPRERRRVRSTCPQ